MNRSYKDGQGIAGDRYKHWTYYELSNESKLVGKGHNAGKEITLSHSPSNFQFGFQIGEAANDKNGNYGMSGWFYYKNHKNKWVQGDLNIDLDDCGGQYNGGGTNDCDIEVVDWKGKVTVCHNGQVLCVNQRAVANLLAQGASLGACQNTLGHIAAQAGGEITTTEEVKVNEDKDSSTTNSLNIASDMTNVSLSTYPNPARDVTTIRYSSSIAGPVQVNIFDVQGQLVGQVYKGQIEKNRTYESQFKVSGLKPGMYLIRVSSQDHIASLKLLVK